MTHHYLFGFLLLLNFFAPAQNVTISDEQFKNYLLSRSDINTTNDGEISVQEAEGFKGKISIRNNHNIYTLAGIEAFTNLTILDCSFTFIDYLNVSKNTALVELSCGFSKISDLDVSKNTALEILFCSSMPLKKLDLSHNTELRLLECARDSLRSLDLSKLTKLVQAHCGYNKLTSLTLGQSPEMEWLDCNANQLTSLDISPLTGLTTLNCSDNKLTSLDVSQNTFLLRLYFGSNSISSIDVSKNQVLEELRFEKNQITTLNVDHNEALRVLVCGYNQLHQLSLKNHFELMTLFCEYNFFGPKLDLSWCTSLQYLNCQHMPDLKTICVSDLNVAELRFQKDSAAIWTTDCTTGIHDIANGTVRPAYPNPFTDHLNIGPGNTGAIYNALGELILVSEKEIIPCEQLSSGIYYLLITTSEGQRFSQKIARQ